jgi:DNA invertase Pin-like site-specific DNA recombinase
MSSVRRNQIPAVTPKKRCAVYTRKSTDEGLDQEYNSLEAQRDAGLAFIASQRHEGWIAVDDGYDDGGYSGGNMERPGLRRLMIDIEAGKIDTVVVYKIDRLTRSLPDFAKLVEVFDRNGVSFVSVTQQFNTTTSMGRLTLNILLSFAQFEREVTGERIRDKIAASKAKGMWMGGVPPLGYDVVERKLVINDREAALVRDIFRRYAEHGSAGGRAAPPRVDARQALRLARHHHPLRLRPHDGMAALAARLADGHRPTQWRRHGVVIWRDLARGVGNACASAAVSGF